MLEMVQGKPDAIALSPTAPPPPPPAPGELLGHPQVGLPPGGPSGAARLRAQGASRAQPPILSLYFWPDSAAG